MSPTLDSSPMEGIAAAYPERWEYKNSPVVSNTSRAIFLKSFRAEVMHRISECNYIVVNFL